MITRTGKIAQLPKLIRHELNHRLENGKQSPEILEWLNSLPETQELVAQKFDHQPITRSNLSDWRLGGFKEWQADQLREARIRRVCETGGSLQKVETGDLFENFARMAIAEMVTDLDALQKLRGEKRADHMRNLVRDLARLQNAYNRSRWADLAWNKYNDNNTGTPAPSNKPSTLNPLPSTLTPPPAVVPNRAQSQAMPPDEGEPKPNGNGMYILHFTNCDCDEPCPKCHAPDSDYPLEDAIRDRRYYRKHHEYPCDRHGKRRFLMNFKCDCYCDRCAEKTAAAFPVSEAIPACRAEALAEAGKTALPRCPIIQHAEVRDETPNAETTPTPPPAPPAYISPLSRFRPLSPSRPPTPIPPAQLADFTRRMALLKTASK